jgi:hypothetical protein
MGVRLGPPDGQNKATGLVRRAPSSYHATRESQPGQKKGAAPMAQASLIHVLEAIKTLDPDELGQVQQAVQEQLAQRRYIPDEERFHEALLASGLVKEIKPPHTTPSGRRPLIQAQGKPVSETIIEERR